MLTIEILQMIIPELTILSIGNAGVKINEKVIRIIIIPPPRKLFSSCTPLIITVPYFL